MVALALVRYGMGQAARLNNLVFFGILAAMVGALYVINRTIGRTRYESEAEHLRTLLADFDNPI